MKHLIIFGMVGNVAVNMFLMMKLQLPGTNTFQINSVVTTKVDSRPGFPHPFLIPPHPATLYTLFDLDATCALTNRFQSFLAGHVSRGRRHPGAWARFSGARHVITFT